MLIDTGPLVAYLNRRDLHHEWAKTQFRRLPVPLLTCEAVVKEAVFLIEDDAGDGTPVLELLAHGILDVEFALRKEARAIVALMKRYRSVPMSLADACLVRMSEIHQQSVLLTLDSDFRVYRRHGRQIVPVLMPTA